KVFAREVFAGDIHAYKQVAGLGRDLSPFSHLLGRFTQDPLGDRDDQTRILCDRTESRRWNIAKLAVVPSQERFEAEQLSVRQSDERLIVHCEFAPVDRMA